MYILAWAHEAGDSYEIIEDLKEASAKYKAILRHPDIEMAHIGQIVRTTEPPHLDIGTPGSQTASEKIIQAYAELTDYLLDNTDDQQGFEEIPAVDRARTLLAEVMEEMTKGKSDD